LRIIAIQQTKWLGRALVAIKRTLPTEGAVLKAQNVGVLAQFANSQKSRFCSMTVLRAVCERKSLI
jgi:hypothetical protein